MKEFVFIIADCCFSVKIPDDWSIAKLLPSFYPFLYHGTNWPELLFRLEADCMSSSSASKGKELLEETNNDLGRVRIFSAENGLHIEISYDEAHERIHTLEVDHQFSYATANIIYGDATAGVALSSMLRMMFAQKILAKEGISVHASCVCNKGKGYLFLGKSGTGKSTHSELWLETFQQSELVNDDNPILRLKEGKVYVYGSPWSGKKHCYRQVCYPVGGIVRLVQASANQFVPLADTKAFAALLPSCSVYRNDFISQNMLYEVIISMIELVPVGTLFCLPNKEAAELCYNSLAVSFELY